MRGGILLLLIGIVMAYLGVSGKYACFTLFAKCVAGKGKCGCTDEAAQQQTVGIVQPTTPGVGIPEIKLPSIPTLPQLPSLKGIVYG
jgi:hypothetical protein